MDDPNDHDVCECGDYRKSHTHGLGPCGVCEQGRAPWDNCTQFRYWYRGDPIPLRRAATPTAGSGEVE